MTSEYRDDELVRRTLAGDAEAFAPLVRRHRRAVLARALAVALDPLDADDIAQGAFVQAYEQLATLREPARFEVWLMTIVHRRALNFIRAEKRRRSEPLSDAIPDRARASAETALANHDLRTTLLAALAKLSLVQRSVVLLADLEDWSHERIAQSLGCSVVMSRRHLSDARRRLRELLAPKVEE
ncbi:MAG: sigma-70 family RNA polymerase sigma factor [Gemmatimonadota bacterium]|nr:sigma-70 family RNA polymerase sigma factor [Gemmatimonadota bacterium]